MQRGCLGNGINSVLSQYRRHSLGFRAEMKGSCPRRRVSLERCVKLRNNRKHLDYRCLSIFNRSLNRSVTMLTYSFNTKTNKSRCCKAFVPSLTFLSIPCLGIVHPPSLRSQDKAQRFNIQLDGSGNREPLPVRMKYLDVLPLQLRTFTSQSTITTPLHLSPAFHGRKTNCLARPLHRPYCRWCF